MTGRSVSASTVRDLTQNGRQRGLTSLLVDVFVVLALGARLALTQAIEEPHSLRRQAFVVGGKLAAEDEADAEREDRMIGRERFDLGRHSTNDRRPSAIAPDPVASVRVRDWIPQLALLRLQLRAHLVGKPEGAIWSRAGAPGPFTPIHSRFAMCTSSGSSS